MITVGKLREALSAFPDEMPVHFSYEAGCAGSDETPSLTVETQADNGFVYPEPQLNFDCEGDYVSRRETIRP